MSRRPQQRRDDPSRPWLAFGVMPPQPPRCDGCGVPSACWGIGPPARSRVFNYCATCNERQPETQEALARTAREALEGEEM